MAKQPIIRPPVKNALEAALSKFGSPETREMALKLLHAVVTDVMVNNLTSGGAGSRDDTKMAAESRCYASIILKIQDALGVDSYSAMSAPKKAVVYTQTPADAETPN